MALGTGSNTRVGYIAEVTAGTTPATPAFNVVAINDFSMNLAKETFTDPSIREDRQDHFLKHGNKTIGGDITVTLVGTGAIPTGNLVYDPWLESVFHAAWTGDVLKIGNTSSSFTFEKTLTDLDGSSNYFRYKGVECSAVNFEVSLNSPVIAKFSFMGLDEDTVATSIITGATYVPQPAALDPFIHTNASNVFNEGGSATTLMTAFSLDVKSDLDVNHALGGDVAVALTTKAVEVTGTATYYFSDASIYNKFVNETESSIDVTLSDGTNSFKIDLPKVIYSEATQTIDNDGTLIVTMPFTAIYDDASASTVVLTRA